MQLTLRYDLPFTVVKVSYQGTSIDVSDVLIDTGSASTILAADIVAAINILPLPQDTLRTIRGIGGRELVFSRRVDYVQIGQCQLRDFEIEIGGMDYGYEINGILGMDFLTQGRALINLKEMRIDFLD